MRELRRQDRKLSEEDARRVLEQSEYGFLATVNEDGSPYVIPMAAAVDRDTLYMHSARTGQKLENLQRDPRACFTSVLYADNQPEEFAMVYASVVAEGRLRVITDEAERVQAMRVIVNKYSPDHIDTPAYERTMRGMPAVVMLAMDIQSIQGKANRGRLRGE